MNTNTQATELAPIEEAIEAIFSTQRLADLFDAAIRESEVNGEHETSSIGALGAYLAEVATRAIPALATALAGAPFAVAEEMDNFRLAIRSRATGITIAEVPAYSHEGGEPLAPATIARFLVSALPLA